MLHGQAAICIHGASGGGGEGGREGEEGRRRAIETMHVHRTMKTPYGTNKGIHSHHQIFLASPWTSQLIHMSVNFLKGSIVCIAFLLSPLCMTALIPDCAV